VLLHVGVLTTLPEALLKLVHQTAATDITQLLQQGALAGAKLAFKLDEKMTPAAVERKVKEVLASRGRKGTDPRDVLRQLSALAYVSRRFGPARELPVMMHAVASMFDTLRNIDDYMETVMWKSCHSYLSRVRYSSYRSFLTSVVLFHHVSATIRL
jgi:Eukaryotic translation initiation factor 3 subunit 8 N-terminus